MSEGDTPPPSSLTEAACLSPTEVQSLINECNHLHLENSHLRDLVCWLRGQFEGMQSTTRGHATAYTLLINESHADFFARKEMEDAWDIVIQQDLPEGIGVFIGESNGE